MKDKFVLDSSVWIEIERNNSSVVDRVKPLIDNNKVCLVDVIIAEVLRGVKTKKDYNILKKLFESFEILSTNWLKVADLAFRVRNKGYTLPLIDIYIAQCVIENKIKLITQDKDFFNIQKVYYFNVEIIPVKTMH